MLRTLKGQEGQNDLIFIGYHLFKEGYYHHDEERKYRNYSRMFVYFISVCVMFFTQIYFIQHIVKENESSMDTAFDVNNIDGNGPDIYKMYTYTKETDKIPGALDYYKENDDDLFEQKFADKTCDAKSAAETEV